MKPRCSATGARRPDRISFTSHLNRVIKEHDLNMIYISGPGHGGPAVGRQYLSEGTYSEIYPNISQDEAGLKKIVQAIFLSRRDSQPRRRRKRPARFTKAANWVIRFSHAFGAVFDNPDLDRRLRRRRRRGRDRPAGDRAGIPTNFSIRPRDGAVLPILHLNGYKIAGPTVLARITHEELERCFAATAGRLISSKATNPTLMHEAMAATLDKVIGTN